jgi:alpha-1,2-mannosyltransferase
MSGKDAIMLNAKFRLGLDSLRPRWLIAMLGIFFLAVLVQYTLKIQHSEHGTRSAFLRWKTQLSELDDGVNVWQKHAYPNPPIMAIFLKPFMQMPPAVGASVWFGCKALLAMAAVLGVLALLDDPQRPFPLWGKLLTIVMMLRPIEGDLMHGNVNLLILFLIVAALIAFCRRRDGLAGMLLGAVGGLIVFVLLIPATVFGWSNNRDYLQSWHNQMVAPFAAGVVTSEHKNQSLPGLLHRMLSEEASFSDYDGDRKVVLETHNLVSWDPRVAQGILLACIGIYAALALALCRTSIAERPHLPMLAEWSVVILGMLLFCERTWKHHCVTLLLPFGVIAYGISARMLPKPLRWQLGAMLALVALLMLSTSTGILDQNIDVQDRLGKIAQVYGAYIWAFLVLLASMYIILWKIRARSPAMGPPS